MQPSSTMPSPGYNWQQRPRDRREFENAYNDALRFYSTGHPAMAIEEIGEWKRRLWSMAEGMNIFGLYTTLGTHGKIPKDPSNDWYGEKYWSQIYTGTSEDAKLVFDKRNSVFIPGPWVLSLYESVQALEEELFQARLQEKERKRVKALQEMGIV